MDKEITESMKQEQPKREDIKTSVPQGDINPAPDPIVRQLPEPPRAEQATADGKAPGQASDGKDFKSAGRRIHNLITYQGVDWLMNSAFGVAFTFWAARTHTGDKYFSGAVKSFFKRVLSPIIKSPKALESGVKWGSMFTSIMVGGFVTIPPVMALENHKIKKRIVRSLDWMIYGKDKVEADPKFKESYDKIDQEPKKDFWIGTGTRLLSLAPLLAITVYEPTSKFMHNTLYERIAKLTKGAAEGIGIKPKGMMTKMAPDATGTVVSDWQFVHNTIGFDFGLTFFYAILHEITYKFFSAMGYKPKESKSQARTERTTSAAATASTQENSYQDPAKDTPSHIVTHITREQHLANVAQVSQLGAS